MFGGGLIGCSFLAVVLAGSGMAPREMETTIQDDAVMLHRPERDVRAAARQMHELGADRVRITASWSNLAPAPLSERKPGKPFDADDSRTYPEIGFDKLDRAVRAADDAGLKVQLDLAFWAPRWAVAKAGRQRTRQRHIPSAKEFTLFARAVARRYSGAVSDPHRRSRKLPAVRMYTTWNEPNHTSFLLPQWKRDGAGGWRPFSPHVYRAMHEAAYDVIKEISPHNVVLVGGTSASGSVEPGQGHVPPLEFLRTMACMDGLGRPLQVRECKGVGPVRADGYAHHPYSLKTVPAAPGKNPDDVPIGDLQKLTDTIAALYRAGRIDGQWPLYVTEYGYETKPPDPYARHTPEAQARYIAWANFLAYRRPETRMFAQFLLRDIDDDESGFPKSSKRRWRDWQTGLLYADGRPKPAAQAFKIPLHMQVTHGQDGTPAVLVFGGVRPGTGRRIVRLERWDPAGERWVGVDTTGRECDTNTAEFGTDPDGFFRRMAPWHGPGKYRLAWRRHAGFEYGAEIEVTADQPIALGP